MKAVLAPYTVKGITMTTLLSETDLKPSPVNRLRVDHYTSGIIGPSQPMLGPLADGGTLITGTPPGCWGPMITPAFEGGHEVTQPVAIAGAEIGDAVAIKIKSMRVTSLATSSGVMSFVEGRYNGDPFVSKFCAKCGTEHPASHVEGIGEDAIRCNNCGAEVSAFRFSHGYVIVFDAQNQVSLTVNQDVANQLAGNACEMSALPEFAAQHSILSLARADIPGVAAHMRPFLGNIGTTPSRDLPDSHNCADFGQYLINAPHRFGMTREELHAAKTDGHMDTNSIREGCVLICPVKVPGAGVYMGRHARPAGQRRDRRACHRLLRGNRSGGGSGEKPDAGRADPAAKPRRLAAHGPADECRAAAESP